MKYAIGAEPIAGLRKQFGGGAIATALTFAGALTKGTKGTGSIAMALLGSLTGRVQASPPPPLERCFIVGSENRTFTVPAEPIEVSPALQGFTISAEKGL